MNTSKLTFFILSMFLFACQTNKGQTIKIVNKEAIKADVIGKQTQLIDVRTAEEYESGHIDNAVNYNIINRDTFLIQVQKLDKNQPVYLYCKMGGRSNRAANLLKEQGFKKIYDYSGGYNDWVTE
ncbi:rhodanese-like domain-containing protein [uncultured Croceitalea sp.]|uniref:rhodanese-like domain-containing protein n=1 Tax=uncultured Croceitalea sp. TaxID=1798908 RepID=UPI003305DD62